MRIYTDIITGKELISDSYKSTLLDGNILEIKGAYVDPDNVDNVDIGCGNEFGGGDDNELESNTEKVMNLVHAFELKPQYFDDKKEFGGFLKSFIKDVQTEHLKDKPEVAKNWDMKNKDSPIMKFFANVSKKFDDCEFYQSSAFEEGDEGVIVIAIWKDTSDSAPHFYYFLDLMKETKL